MDKGRTEAFSDGVLAVAITLLVLDLQVEATEGSLAGQLRRNWPNFAAFLVSFFVIGVIWVNHHGLFTLVTEVDRVLLFENLALLMFVTTLPFTTSTLAKFLPGGGPDARWAVLLYGVSNIGMAVSFTAMLSRIASRSAGQPGRTRRRPTSGAPIRPRHDCLPHRDRRRAPVAAADVDRHRRPGPVLHAGADPVAARGRDLLTGAPQGARRWIRRNPKYESV